MNDVTEQKEYYKLWVKFLKDSDDYKKYCVLFGKRKKEARKLLDADASEEDIFNEAFTEIHEEYGRRFFRTYIIFGDVFENFKFERWWENWFLEAFELQKTKLKALTTANTFLPTIMKRLNKQLSKVCKQNNKVKTLSENIQEQLEREFEGDNPVYIKVDFRFPKSQLLDEFKNMIEDFKKKNPSSRLNDMQHLNKTMVQPVGGRLSEAGELYDSYLVAYKLDKEGKNHIEIAKALKLSSCVTNEEKLSEMGKKTIGRYIEKAGNIMRNLEKCEFPGKYL